MVLKHDSPQFVVSSKTWFYVQIKYKELVEINFSTTIYREREVKVFLQWPILLTNNFLYNLKIDYALQLFHKLFHLTTP